VGVHWTVSAADVLHQHACVMTQLTLSYLKHLNVRKAERGGQSLQKDAAGLIVSNNPTDLISGYAGHCTSCNWSK